METKPNNAILQGLVNEDQYEYTHYKECGNNAIRNSRKRIKKLRVLLQNQQLETAGDYYWAALLLQHSDYLDDFKASKECAEIAIGKGSKEARFIYAVATDRLLVAEHKKQKFATQYATIQTGFNNAGPVYKLELYDYDKRTTDDARKEYNVPSIIQLKKQCKKLSNELFATDSQS